MKGAGYAFVGTIIRETIGAIANREDGFAHLLERLLHRPDPQARR
jgi:hypothetical protein